MHPANAKIRYSICPDDGNGVPLYIRTFNNNTIIDGLRASKAYSMYGFGHDFSSYSESAETRHADSQLHVCDKMSPYFFSPRAGRQGFKRVHESSPPTAHPHLYISIYMQGPKSYIVWRRRDGGGIFTLVCPYFSALLQTGTFFHTKRVGMANLSGYRATWKIATKSAHTPDLHGALKLICQSNWGLLRW